MVYSIQIIQGVDVFQFLNSLGVIINRHMLLHWDLWPQRFPILREYIRDMFNLFKFLTVHMIAVNNCKVASTCGDASALPCSCFNSINGKFGPV